MPGRNGGENYRYAYQGSEVDNEVKGNGNSYTTFYRELDPRLGRWLSLDPKTSEMADWSPYSSNFNSPLIYNDVKGDIPLPIVIYYGYVALVGVTTAAIIYSVYQFSQSAAAATASYYTSHLVAESTGVVGVPGIQDIPTEDLKALSDEITDALYKQ